MLEICRHKGHCLHRDDNARPFVRHENNKRGLVDLTCCWCEKKVALEGFAKNTKEPPPSSYLPNVEHGPFLPVPTE